MKKNWCQAEQSTVCHEQPTVGLTVDCWSTTADFWKQYFFFCLRFVSKRLYSFSNGNKLFLSYLYTQNKLSKITLCIIIHPKLIFIAKQSWFEQSIYIYHLIKSSITLVWGSIVYCNHLEVIVHWCESPKHFISNTSERVLIV